MIQKIIKVGNSYAIIIPHHVVKTLNLKAGQIAYSDFDEYEKIVTFYFKKSDYEKAQKENMEFRKMVRNFNLRYKDILDKLSSKKG